MWCNQPRVEVAPTTSSSQLRHKQVGGFTRPSACCEPHQKGFVSNKRRQRRWKLGKRAENTDWKIPEPGRARTELATCA